MDLFARSFFISAVFLSTATQNVQASFFLDDNEIKIYTDEDYFGYDINKSESCLPKDQIIEKQIWFEFKNYSTQFSPEVSDGELRQYGLRTVKELRSIANLWDCHFKNFHLDKNEDKSNPSMEQILSFIKEKASQGGERFEISGTQKFYGLFKKKYRYAINIKEDGKVSFEVLVHFKFGKMPLEEKEQFLQRVSSIESIWNSALPTGYSLRFIEVDNPYDAHYSIKIRPNTRSALYDKFWSSNIGSEDYAHEVTHMLGLNEEYNIVRANVLEFLYGPNDLEKNLSSQIDDEKFQFSFMVSAESIRSNKCFVYGLNCIGKRFYFKNLAQRINPTISPYQFHHMLRQLPVNQ